MSKYRLLAFTSVAGALALLAVASFAQPTTNQAPVAEAIAAPKWTPVTVEECKTPPKPTPPGPKPKLVPIQVQGVPGADVSKWEGVIDWTKLGAQKQFVIMRFSYGALLDVKFNNYWPAARKVGVVRGVYHYLDPANSHPFASQLRNFVKGVKLEAGDLPPILDLENPCLWVHLSEQDRIRYILKWTHAFEKVYGVKPILYMSPSFVDRALGGAASAAVLGQYPLWIANFGVPTPTIPLPWTSYIIWQYSDDTPMAGVSIPADGNVAPGTLADLHKYTLKQSAGGNDSVLTKHDLDDEGLTKKTPSVRPPPSSRTR